MRYLLVSLLLIPALFAAVASATAQVLPVYCDTDTLIQVLNSVDEILLSVDERIDTDTPVALRADLNTARGMLTQVKNGCFTEPTQQATTYVIVSNQGVNARSCPGTRCRVLSVLAPGDEIQPTGIVSGETVSGSSEWYRIDADGQMAFIHSSLVSEEGPSAPSATSTPLSESAG